jgi:RecB family exonuclease
MTLLLRFSLFCKSLSYQSIRRTRTDPSLLRSLPTSCRCSSSLLDSDYSRRTVAGSRRAASTAATKFIIEEDISADNDPPLYHPDDFFKGSLPYPASLSPSSILEFQKCPQSFLFQYIYKLKQPTSTALAKGSMCHSALEQVFDLTPEQRTLENLQNLFRKEWSQNRLSKQYGMLFEIEGETETDDSSTPRRDLKAEGEWGRQGLQLLESYYRVEDPRKVTRPNPMQREIWVKAQLAVDSTMGATGYTNANAVVANANAGVTKDSASPSFLVRGIVDRLDLVQASDKSVALRVVDYKTGKAPNLKYSAAMNKQIADEAFFQLKCYALLIREKGAASAIDSTMDLRWLRLFYLTSESGEAAFMDMDLGDSPQSRDRLLQEVHAELANVWNKILELVSMQDATQFVGCDRSFCYCHKCRPRFVPGTVWEPPV